MSKELAFSPVDGTVRSNHSSQIQIPVVKRSDPWRQPKPPFEFAFLSPFILFLFPEKSEGI